MSIPESSPTPLVHELPDLLTIREVASLLRVSPITVKRWEKQGTLTPVRINSRGDRRYVKDDITTLLERKSAT